MRIIGGRDYYDSAMRFGHDASTVFVREAGRRLTDQDLLPIASIQVIFADAKRLRRFVGLSGRTEQFTFHDSSFTVARLAVIFCGVIHHGVVITTGSEFDSKSHCFWEMSKLTELMDKFGLRILLARHSPSSLEAALFGSQPVDKRLLTWLIANRIVHAIRFPQTFYANAEAWEINSSRLKEVEFFRKFDVYQTYQEIEMWVSGVMPGKTNAMESISDAVRIAKHGFNRYSFRRSKHT